MEKLKIIFTNLTFIFFTALVPTLAIKTHNFDIKKDTPKELCESIQNIFNNSSKPVNHTVYELSEFIQDRNIDINIKDECGNTALHFAAQKGCNNVIKLLIELGAKINARARQTIMPDWNQIKNNGAIRIKYPKLNEKDFNKLEGFFIAKYVIKKYQSNKNRKACKFKNLFDKKSKQEDLLSNQPFSKEDIIQLQIKNCTPLHDAICNGLYDTAKLLIELGANINMPIEHEFTIILPKKKNKKDKEEDTEQKVNSKIIRLEINPKNIAKNMEYEDLEAMIEENQGYDHMNTKIENNIIENEN